MKRQGGFTLLELVVTVALVGIMAMEEEHADDMRDLLA